MCVLTFMHPYSCFLATLPDLSVGAEGASIKDSLMWLGELHQLTGWAMEGVFRTLWPKEKLPEDQLTLAQRL